MGTTVKGTTATDDLRADGSTVRVVEDTLRRHNLRLRRQAGRIATRSASGCEIGPQRYHDPAIWGPDYELRGAPLGQANSAQRIATMARVPPTADRRYLEIADFLASGSRYDLGAPGDGRMSSSQIACLAESLLHQSRHTQRCVEHVAFGTHGGQSWTRDIQLRIPQTAQPASDSWRIVPLGHFARRHLPDFSAADADGQRLNLLNRDQHGFALTMALLGRCVDSLRAEHLARLQEPAAGASYRRLRARLFDFLTRVGDLPDPELQLLTVVAPYGKLLKELGVPAGASDQRVADLANACAELLDGTPHLCWVEASAGEILGLRVSYTTRDPKHNPAYNALMRSFTQTAGDSYASLRAELDRDLGLGPIKHEFAIPSSRHVGSYAFTIAPPEKTSPMYLDWGSGNSLQRQETTSCSLDSGHLSDADGSLSASPAGGRVRAFLRVSPHQRVQILAAAALNIVIVLMLKDGYLSDRLPGFILAAPSGLIAYLVSQQRHYYAYPMRKQRAILWGYLGLSILFLVTVSLSQEAEGVGRLDFGSLTELLAWALFVSSAAILVWYLPLGFGFNWIVAYFTRKLWNRPNPHDQEWEAYVAVYQVYGRLLFYGVVGTAVAAAIFLAFFWHDGPPSRQRPAEPPPVLVRAP